MPPSPLPIEGHITLRKFYQYFAARSDYTDHLCNSVLKQNKSDNQEVITLINGLYLDLATFQEEMKDVKRKLDKIAEDYWKERQSKPPVEGRHANFTTPERPSVTRAGVLEARNKASKSLRRIFF